MNVLDVLNSPWALTPEALDTIREIYYARIEGRETDWLREHRAEAEARGIGGVRGSGGEDPPYQNVNGVAVVPLQGVIAQRMNLFSAISGGTSSQLFAQAVRMAAEDPMVDAIVLSIDSPGGTVAGTPEAAAAVRAAREVKPVASWTDNQMASAAYWIGSAANEVYISSGVTTVGSIGVVATHKDISGAEAQRGVKTTEIVAGKYKRIASNYEPLSDAGKASIQEYVNYLYSVFVGQVAENRGASIEKVLTKMADGRAFTGSQAVDAGLADGVATLDEVMAKVRDKAAERRATTQREKFAMLTAEQVRNEHAAVARELEQAGAAAERTRIRAIQDAALPGHEALVATLIESGVSAGDAALQIMAAEKAKVTAAGTGRSADAQRPVDHAAPKTEQAAELTREQKAAKASEHAAANKVDFVTAYQQLFPGER